MRNWRIERGGDFPQVDPSRVGQRVPIVYGNIPDGECSMTWDDIERAARNSPHLHSAVTMADGATVTREQALIWAALKLAEDLAASQAAHAKTMALMPFHIGAVFCGRCDAEIPNGATHHCQSENPPANRTS